MGGRGRHVSLRFGSIAKQRNGSQDGKCGLATFFWGWVQGRKGEAWLGGIVSAIACSFCISCRV